MPEIAVAPYRLEGDFPRDGALLRVRFGEIVGYADCFPWSERGDLPLNQQIEALKQSRSTPLLARSLWFALQDAEARSKNHSLFEGLSIPLSQCLVMSNIHQLEKGYSHYKLKIAPNEADRFCHLVEQAPNSLFRLDFNGKATAETLLTFLRKSSNHIEKIEFIEDPFPYHSNWGTIQNKHQLTFALDLGAQRGVNDQSVKIIVIKPAVEHFSSNKKIVVTSYLDHPVGQMFAAYYAALLYKKNPKQLMTCGLLTHKIYKANPFSEQINHIRGQLMPTEGSGIGFDQLLKDEKFTVI